MKRLALAVCAAALLAGCGDQKPAPAAQETQPPAAAERPAANPLKNAYFGDLHLHTRNSFDAYIFNVRASPDEAYAYAKGGTIKHAAGFDMKLNSGPLDFLAVTDHSEYLGVLQAIDTASDPYSKVPYGKDLFSTDQAKVTAAFRKFADTLDQGKRMDDFKDLRTVKSAWHDIIESAKRNYEPGKFTTLVGYEFTSAPGGRNLHRNVIFQGDKVPELPYTALESQNPEDLWNWMEQQRANGMEALSIPHNANGSDGTMYERTKWNGQPIDKAWAEMRQRNEPLTEITQVKGTSETHLLLSPNDELAGFEIMEWYIGQAKKITKFDGGYVRKALKDGLFRSEGRREPVQVRPRRGKRQPQRGGQLRGEQLSLEGRHPRRDAGAAGLCAAGRQDVGELQGAGRHCPFLDVGRVRPDGRVGAGEYARRDLCGAAPEGDVCDVWPAHPCAVLRRLWHRVQPADVG